MHKAQTTESWPSQTVIPFLAHTPLFIRFKAAKMDDTAGGLTLPSTRLCTHTRRHMLMCLSAEVCASAHCTASMLASLSVSVGQSQRMTHHFTLTLHFPPSDTDYKDETYSI